MSTLPRFELLRSNGKYRYGGRGCLTRREMPWLLQSLPYGIRPYPFSETFTHSESGSFDPIAISSLLIPLDPGSKVTLIVQWLTPLIVGIQLPQGLKKGFTYTVNEGVTKGEILAWRSSVPKLYMVINLGFDDCPTSTLPKSTLAGLTRMFGSGAGRPIPLRGTHT